MIFIFILYQLALASETYANIEDFTDYSLVVGTNSICSTKAYNSTILMDQNNLTFLLNTQINHYRIAFTFALYVQQQQTIFFQLDSNIKSYTPLSLYQVRHCNTEFPFLLEYLELKFETSNTENAAKFFSITSSNTNKFVINELKIYIYRCSKNCLQCLFFSHCNKCKPNFKPSQITQCVCPYNTPFQFNDQCLAFCPSGYYGFENKCHQFKTLQNLFVDNQTSQFILVNDYNTTFTNQKFYNDSDIFVGPLIQNEAILYKLSQPIKQMSNVLIDFEVFFLDCNIQQFFSFYLDDNLFDEIFIYQNEQVAVASTLISYQNCYFVGYERCFQIRITYFIKEIQQLETIKLKGNLPINNQTMKWTIGFMRIYKIELPELICLKKQYFTQCVDKCPITSKMIGNVCKSIQDQYPFSTILAQKYSEYNSVEEFPSHELTSDHNIPQPFFQFYNNRYLFGGYKIWTNKEQIFTFYPPPHFKIKVYFQIILIDPLDPNDIFKVIFPNTNLTFSHNHPAAQCFNRLGSNSCNQQDQIGLEDDDYLISFEEEINHTEDQFILNVLCSSESSQFYCAIYDLIVLSVDCPLNCRSCQSSSDCLEISDSNSQDGNQIFYECPEQGYYKNQGKCEQCPNFCEICTNSNDCIKCKENYKMVGKKCICLYNNVINHRTQCNNICHSSCSLCQSDSQASPDSISYLKSCAACNAEDHKVLNMNVCICMDGYYMNYQTSPYSCLPCTLTCLTCHSQDNCVTCQPGQNRELYDYVCNCIQGYFEFNDLQICQQCDSLCKTCLYEADHCTACYSETFRTLSNNSCLCQQGFYEDHFGNCQKCNIICETCSKEIFCLTCDENQFRILQKQSCICLEGYFENNQQLCERCYYSCSRCNNNNNQYQCIQCPSTRVRSEQNNIELFDCLCNLGYYDIGDLQCLPCYQLQNPSQEHICYQKCGDNIVQWNEECDDGNSEARDGCDQCLLPDSNCLDQHCNQCQFKQCIQCSDGYYLNHEFKCLKCSNNCLTCQNSEQNCLECKYKTKQTNICMDCNQNKGFYQIDNECLPMCGDGIKTDLEECDDNNTLDDDGCSQYCYIEQGYKCEEICMKIQYLKILLQEDQFDSIYNNQKSIILYFNQDVQLKQVEEISTFIIVKPIQNDLEFEILTISVSQTSTILIQIKLKTSYINPQIFVQLNNTIIKDIKNFAINDSLIGFIKLQNYYQQNQLNVAATENIVNISISILYFMLILAIIAFLFGGLEIFWNLLDTLQLICYLKYFNVIYPYNLEQYFQLFSFAEFDFIKNYFNIEGQVTQYLGDSKAPSKFLNEGYSAAFLVNIVSFLVVLMTTLFTILASKTILYILMHQTNKFKKFRIFNSKTQFQQIVYIIFSVFQKIENLLLKYSFYFENTLLRAYMCSAFDLNLAIFLQISNIQLANPFLFASFFLSIIFFAAQCFILFYGIKVINKIRTYSKSEIQNFQLEAFFEEVEVRKNSYVAYYTIFNQFKKILFTGFLVNLYYFPCFQIGCISILSLSCSLFLYYKKPIKYKNDLIKQTLTEITLWVIQIITLFISINEQNKWWNYTQLEYFGWAIITLLNLIILLQLFFDVHQHFKYLLAKYQILRNFKSKICNFFNQQTNNESEFTIESENTNQYNNTCSLNIQNNKGQVQNRILLHFVQSKN